jgi:hypothetical protein
VLSAKLFAALAGIVLTFALLGREQVVPHQNLGLSVGRIVLGPYYWQLFGAMACAILAFAYFGVARWLWHPPDQPIGLVSFVLVSIALVILLISSFFITSTSSPSRRLLIPLFAAICSFLLGLVLSAVNVAWAVWRQ